jgi:hypothetical protein
VTKVSSAERTKGQPSGREVAEEFFGNFQAPISPVANPLPFLYDLRLPLESYVDKMRPVLATLGCLIEEGAVTVRQSREQHQFTILKKGAVGRLLLRIPGAILKEFTPLINVVLPSVLDRIRAENESASLYVIHDVDPHPAIRTVLNAWAATESMTFGFVPLRDIDYYFSEEQDAESQVQFLMTTFALPASEQIDEVEETAKHISQLPSSDMRRVVDIIADLAAFQDDTGRRNLVQTAEIEEAVGDINDDQPPRQVAWLIARRALEHGLIQEQGEEIHTFHRLLTTVIDVYTELPQRDAAFLTSIIEEYDFGPDPD